MAEVATVPIYSDASRKPVLAGEKQADSSDKDGDSWLSLHPLQVQIISFNGGLKASKNKVQCVCVESLESGKPKSGFNVQ